MSLTSCTMGLTVGLAPSIYLYVKSENAKNEMATPYDLRNRIPSVPACIPTNHSWGKWLKMGCIAATGISLGSYIFTNKPSAVPFAMAIGGVMGACLNSHDKMGQFITGAFLGFGARTGATFLPKKVAQNKVAQGTAAGAVLVAPALTDDKLNYLINAIGALWGFLLTNIVVPAKKEAIIPTKIPTKIPPAEMRPAIVIPPISTEVDPQVL